MIKVKACPHCGGEAVYKEFNCTGIHGEVYKVGQVSCKDCECMTKPYIIDGYMGVKHSPGFIINRWNAREPKKLKNRIKIMHKNR